MTKQTEAERLADALCVAPERSRTLFDAAAELRRLVSFNQQLMDEVARLQKREWVGLTDDEYDEIWRIDLNNKDIMDKTIAKLKEKNHDHAD